MFKLVLTIRNKFKKIVLSPNEYAKSLGVKLGKCSWLSTKNFPSEGFLIEIGDYVRIASGTSFYTHGGIWSIRHLYNDYDIEICGKIKVGSYTSIGANVMIMPGVTIGERCIVAGGSVVTKSVPDGCMVAGNPAKFIGYTEDFYHRLKEKYDLKCHKMSESEKIAFIRSQKDDRFIKKGYIRLGDEK